MDFILVELLADFFIELKKEEKEAKEVCSRILIRVFLGADEIGSLSEA